MRQDLLALTPDDLALLANRGLVKRAQQELLAGDLRWELAEDADGTVTVVWSDGVVCVLPPGRPPTRGQCSCPAATGCRHLIRTALLYQHVAAARAGSIAPVALHEPWDPGAIDDTELARALPPHALAWARDALEQGQVLELVRGAKPSAYLHPGAVLVRFLVRGDLRYTHCDCAEAAPCRHVALAVWAFRLLPPDRNSGLVETAPPAAPPIDLLDALEAALRELAALGLSGAAQPLTDRLRRLEQRCRTAGLVWPAEALADLLQQQHSYAAHDARFAPDRLLALVAELCIRADAIRTGSGAVPQLFVRGSAADRETATGTARLVGLGCGVRVRRGGVDLAAYLLDAESGAPLVVRRAVDDPAGGGPPPFWQLAQQPAAGGVALAALGRGQALARGGRRLPNAAFIPERARLALNPQGYQWERLPGRALVEDFAELAGHVAAQPPAALRPRRLTEGLYLCPLAGAEDATFDVVQQAVRATLRDPAGGTAALRHPFTTRGHGGAEALLVALRERPGDLRFVAGHVAQTAHGLVIAPTALVLQDGQTRRALLPWVDRGAERAAEDRAAPFPPAGPLAAYWARVDEALAELLLVGLLRADVHMARRWRELARDGQTLGFARVLLPVERLAAELERKLDTLHWPPDSAAAAALELACAAHFANALG
ncbi:MAG TPA: hypothetical protein VFS21_01350 [Roseiflexaceae bacterium]|nr:hypothetical protein [Roseiflexaceae bacterium]